MKRKTFKINQNTLFIYQQNSVQNNDAPTEPTTNMTVTTSNSSGMLTIILGTSGITGK
ncbi:hypothetical protein [Pedobacter sp. Hv1]|uniref:hypothetical protein n=1 Tax=Pedobacter sp. Hv1 TaxID=1740090 RepID=UPI000A9FB3E3|nr:hypothetical protein [Pedobacter sp. Hv1]